MSVCRREQQPHAQAEMTASVAPGPDALQKSSPLFWAWTRHLQTNVRQTGGNWRDVDVRTQYSPFR